jgi:hypothetical protein
MVRIWCVTSGFFVVWARAACIYASVPGTVSGSRGQVVGLKSW